TSSTASSQAKTVTIVGIGGALSDPFWSTIKKGGDAAARDLGVTFDYEGPANYNNLGPDLAQIEQSVLARKPNAVVSGNFIPDAQTAGLRALVAAGIPLIEYNAGQLVWQKDGARAFIGQAEDLAGEAAGKELLAAGVTHGLCVNHIPGNPTLELRCAGLKKA